MSTAVLFDAYGTSDELYGAEVPVPVPASGEVVVRYTAIGVNPIDWKLLGGDLRDLVPMDLPGCLGVEAAGVVVDVGAGVRRFQVGNAVIRHGRPGTYRQYDAVPAAQEADELTAQPGRFSAEQAAVLPVAAGTAYSALVQVGLRAGERLLVRGASGGVGLAAVQLARLMGAEVIGTASARHHRLLRRLGATPVAYGDGLLDRLAPLGPSDASVDCAGGPQPTETAAELVQPRVRRVTVAWEPGARAGDVPHLEHVPLELASTLDLIGHRPFELPVAARFPLSQAAEALDLGRKGGLGGKIVLLPGATPTDRLHPTSPEGPRPAS
ncbi:NADP-dependent oxidoreductase [Streptomyces sp. SLBN-31]|uniref:NADP-dependent oxidoreductase n=1 Tax=Streptomyces sp. SLBN-31 TaxID=2768444 RepID=UPI00116E5275|nr:NADP-dependent oxidoreductase [Streptomyces sp. SLBN-31]TQJ90117.1 NADPH:quinone reductase-like Zn-dependent oxidoreductase [Streptomyces sp. SLBN-31]